MCRLAWFTPLPPVRSGISAYSAELLPLLGEQNRVDVFVDSDVPDTTGQLAWSEAQAWSVPRGPFGRISSGAADASARRSAAAPTVWPAWDFLRLHHRQPYDLIIYQVGNSPTHDYLWGYMARFPGLVVLHDGVLHHARARALLRAGRVDAYRAEFRFNHPDADPVGAEYAVAGFPGTWYYRWTMRRLVACTARAIAVHSRDLEESLQREAPETPVFRLRHGARAPVRPARLPWRQRDHVFVFGVAGLVTQEKRIPAILKAFADAFGGRSDVHLLIVGETVPHFDAEVSVASLRLTGQVTLTGFVPDDELDGWLHAADAWLCLRWPSAGETSGAWIRTLGAGKPTIISAVSQYLDVPTVDAATGVFLGPRAQAARAPWRDAVCLSVDLLHEVDALAEGMRRLRSDTALREALGRNARAWWERWHTPEGMAADYRAAIERALRTSPTPAADLPLHVLDDASSRVGEILEELGPEAVSLIDAAWLGSSR